MKKAIAALLLCLILGPSVAAAHHGGVSFAYGPGTPVDTASPLTLPQGGFVLSGRVEQVEWRKFSWADPENKSSFTFANLGLSYGVTPYLTASAFFPFSVKRQDSLGENSGFGDIMLALQLGFNHDPKKGLTLNSQEDTAVVVEEAKKTYFALYSNVTLPTGRDNMELGGEVDPGMQPGFGSPSYTFGFTAGRHIAGPLGLVFDTSYQLFTERDNFRFGNELRVNLASVWELYGKPEGFLSRIDGIFELNFLNIARDEEAGEKQPATGGSILYLSPGLRFTFPKLQNASLGILFKFPAFKHLNEQDEQQGSEGLEKFRGIMTLSIYF